MPLLKAVQLSEQAPRGRAGGARRGKAGEATSRSTHMGAGDQPSDFTEYYDVIENGEGHTGYDVEIWKYVRARARLATHATHSRACVHALSQIYSRQESGSRARATSGRATSTPRLRHALCRLASIVKGMEENGDTEQAMIEYKKRLQDSWQRSRTYIYVHVVLCAVNAAKERLDGCSYLGEGPELLDSMKPTSHPLLTDKLQLAASNIKQHEEEHPPGKLRLRTRDVHHELRAVQHLQVTRQGVRRTRRLVQGAPARGRGEGVRPAAQFGLLTASRSPRYVLRKLSDVRGSSSTRRWPPEVGRASRSWSEARPGPDGGGVEKIEVCLR